MESKKLEALIMSVDLGSFTRAAEVLGYTQSGLTHMMNSLEREVGFTILDRGRSGVTLTEAGERIAPAIREFLRANAFLDNAIRQAQETRGEVIRISAFASMAMHWLPLIIQRFREQYPTVDVDIRMADHVNAPYELLRQGKMDLVFASRQDGDFYDWLHLADDPMYAVLPKGYAADGGSFPIERFDAQEFIMPSQGFDHDILRVFNQNAVSPSILPSMVDDAAVIHMVAHGLGISMMTELTLRGRTDQVLTLPVAPAVSRELGMAVRSLDDAPESVKAFIRITQELVPELQKQG